MGYQGKNIIANLVHELMHDWIWYYFHKWCPDLMTSTVWPNCCEEIYHYIKWWRGWKIPWVWSKVKEKKVMVSLMAPKCVDNNTFKFSSILEITVWPLSIIWQCNCHPYGVPRLRICLDDLPGNYWKIMFAY